MDNNTLWLCIVEKANVALEEFLNKDYEDNEWRKEPSIVGYFQVAAIIQYNILKNDNEPSANHRNFTEWTKEVEAGRLCDDLIENMMYGEEDDWMMGKILKNPFIQETKKMICLHIIGELRKPLIKYVYGK